MSCTPKIARGCNPTRLDPGTGAWKIFTLFRQVALYCKPGIATTSLSFEKQGKGTEKVFITRLIKKGHLSVLEHAYATFRVAGVSRAFTHQLVRHRLCSFTQQSQRYVDESHFFERNTEDRTKEYPRTTDQGFLRGPAKHWKRFP